MEGGKGTNSMHAVRAAGHSRWPPLPNIGPRDFTINLWIWANMCPTDMLHTPPAHNAAAKSLRVTRDRLTLEGGERGTAFNAGFLDLTFGLAWLRVLI